MDLSLRILFFVSILFVFSHASEIHGNDLGDDGDGDDGLHPVRMYSVGEVEATAETKYRLGNITDFVLAEEKTRRRDPANNFKYYTGGWNISNYHYWTSVGYSAAPLVSIAALWFLLFGFTLLLICCCCCCCPRNKYSYSKIAYVLSLILLILSTIAVVIGCGVLYYGQEKLHKNNSKTLEFIVDQANYTVGNLRQFASTMVDAKNVNLEQQVVISPELRSDIDDLHRKLNYSANQLAFHTNDNSDKIENGLYKMRLLLIIVSAVMLALAFLGSLSSLLGLQCFVSFLLLVGWILVAGTFLSSAIFLLLHNVYSDTCTAMGEWVQHPQEHTAIDDILPCVDYQTANQSLYHSKEVTFQVVDGVNNIVSTIANLNFGPSTPPTAPNYNQSGPLVPLLCNPFLANTTSRKCSSGEVDLANATQKYTEYICTVGEFGPPGATVEVCTSVGRLTPNLYKQIAAAIEVSFGIYHYGPFLTDLLDCSFVRQTMTSINNNNCPGLEKYSKWVYIGLVLVSSAVMLSLLFWAIYTREKLQRQFVKDHNFLRRYPLVPPRPIPPTTPV